MAQGSALLVSLLVLTSVVRPEARDNDVDLQSTDHETVKCFSSVVDPATKRSPLRVKRSSQTSSEEGKPNPSSRISLTNDEEKNDSNIASKVTNSEEHYGEFRAEDKKNAKNGKVSGQKAAQNLEETGRNQKPRSVEEASRKADDSETTTADDWMKNKKKLLLANIDLDSLIAQTIGIGDVTADVTRTRRDLRNLKRIIDDEDDDDAETSTEGDEAGEDYLDNDEHEAESVDQSNYEVPQMGESTSGETYRRQDFSKRPKYYPDWGPKRTWRINMMRVWGKRNVGDLEY